MFDALIEAGYRMQDIAIYGDSAGGAMTASTILNLRDQGKGMPAAAVFWSPNTDLSSPDDSTVTLDPSDPILTYATLLVTGAKAYAGDVPLDDPRVSPLYADLSKGSPPRADHRRHEGDAPQLQRPLLPGAGYRRAVGETRRL